MKAYSKKFLTGLYAGMVKIRFCEEALVDPILKREILCPVHLCSGQEAVAVGVCAALGRRDAVFGNHRSHGHYLAKGGALNRLVAELYGKETGCSRGRGGSMHLCDPDSGFIGSAPIVAGTIPLALGAALASRIRRDRRVTVSFFGDGATGEGVFYESLNFAALKKLPLLFVCENNLYSTHMPIRECRPCADIYRAGAPLCVRSFVCDGNDVLEVYETAKKAVSFCRAGNGPVLIECKTYRLRGHVGPDDNIQGTHTDIRPEKEIAAWRKKDPVNNFAKFLLRRKVLSQAGIKKIMVKARCEVEAALDFARRSSYPQTAELERYVFSLPKA